MSHSDFVTAKCAPSALIRASTSEGKATLTARWTNHELSRIVRPFVCMSMLPIAAWYIETRCNLSPSLHASLNHPKSMNQNSFHTKPMPHSALE